MPPPFILGLKNILDRNDKSELVPHLENSVRIIISWTKAAKSISPTGVRFCFCVQDKPDSNAFE